MSKDINEIKDRMTVIRSKVDTSFSQKAEMFLDETKSLIDLTPLETLKEEYHHLKRLVDIHHSCDQVARGRMSVEVFTDHYKLS